MSIGFLFGGRAQLCEETWEPFSMAEEPADDYCAAEWADIISRAKRKGIETKFTAEGLKMFKHGEEIGSFKDYRGGVKLANKCLDRW